jgi:hypothetical protein
MARTLKLKVDKIWIDDNCLYVSGGIPVKGNFMWAWPFPQMKQPESPKYKPKSTEPVGSWLTKEKNVWICKCWANLDYERHGKDEFICEKCKWQQPIS